MEWTENTTNQYRYFLESNFVSANQNEEIKKSTAGQGKDSTTGCLVDYNYVKNQYRLIAVDLNRQKELDADPKAIHQVEFIGKLKNDGNENAGGI